MFLFISLISFYFALRKLGYIPSFKYLFDNSESYGQKTAIYHKVLPLTNWLNYEKSLTNLLKNESTIDQKQFSVLIEKHNYRLTIYYKKLPIKSYPVVFGSNPIKDKLKEGDRCTPEGLFQIQDKYNHNSWSRFIWLNYPTKQSWNKHLKAKSEGRISLLSPIGGQVGIHGVPKDKDNWIEEKQNWTWGCISLKTNDIKEIYQFLREGNTVEIIH